MFNYCYTAVVIAEYILRVIIMHYSASTITVEPLSLNKFLLVGEPLSHLKGIEMKG